LVKRLLATLALTISDICGAAQLISESDAVCLTNQLNDGERIIRSIFLGSRLTSVEQACVNANAINREYRRNDRNYVGNQMLDQDFRKKVDYALEHTGTEITPMGTDYAPGFSSIERQRRAIDDKLPGYKILTSE